MHKHEVVLLGKVIRNFEVVDPSQDIDKMFSPFFNKMYEATIQVSMKIKGETDAETLRFNYFGEKDWRDRSLSVGDVILYTPKKYKDHGQYAFWLEPFLMISRNDSRLWYENINLRAGADVLKYLGYRAYDKNAALRIFEQFYGEAIPSDITMTVNTNYQEWKLSGVCNHLFEVGCAQKDFCYTISFFSGELRKCREYSKTVYEIPD